MRYFSTNHNTPPVSLKEAVLESLAKDNGLFMPEYIPRLPDTFIENLHKYNFQEISFTVAKTLLNGDIPDEDVLKIIYDAINFDAPLREIEDNIYTLELFHGPTLAFKDFGARFMSRLISVIAEKSNRELTILVATSGDTGSAVAQGFLGVDGVKVKILYPSGKVSFLQEQQLTTCGNNITAIEINGTFDDCQRMVKQAFHDKEITSKLTLTSANSINIARLIPQSFYYFYAYSQLKITNEDIVFSVPSGNYGNLTAGLIAKTMGLPIKKFIASSNINSVVPEYLHTGTFNARPSLMTISNAMDVGNPSNFSRMLELYGHQTELMRNDISGYSISDEETRQSMKDVYANINYIMDPHAAVAYSGLKKHLKTCMAPTTGIFLETAHPAKFKSIVDETLGTDISIPLPILECMSKKKESIKIENSYEELKNILVR